MAKIRNENKGNEIIPRSLIFDNRLSDRARFVYCYMSAKPEGWDFVLAPMAKELGYSTDTARKYINELVEYGWISRGEQKKIEGTNKFGCVEYIINSRPSRIGKNPIREKPDTEKTRDGKNPTQDINSTINSPLNDISTINSPDNNEREKTSKEVKNTRSKTPEEEQYQEKMKERFPRIMRMEQPLTLEQAKKLKAKYDSDLIAKVMQDMENWKPLIKKMVSAYMTINNWCQRELEKQ